MTIATSTGSGPVATIDGTLYVFSNGDVKINSKSTTGFAYVEYDARQ